MAIFAKVEEQWWMIDFLLGLISGRMVDLLDSMLRPKH